MKKGYEGRGEELTALKIENTRLEEQRNAAQARGDELKAQMQALQADFTAALKTGQSKDGKASRASAKSENE